MMTWMWPLEWSAGQIKAGLVTPAVAERLPKAVPI
jgi:hypothetical protein